MAVRFGSSVEVTCYRNLNLLAHAQMEEVDVGSQCGGFGVCGGDRVKVVCGRESLSPLSEAEREHLNPEEIASGFRLACQAFPQEDGVEIVLESPDEKF